jgi:hypothetical protein
LLIRNSVGKGVVIKRVFHSVGTKVAMKLCCKGSATVELWKSKGYKMNEIAETCTRVAAKFSVYMLHNVFHSFYQKLVSDKLGRFV